MSEPKHTPGPWRWEINLRGRTLQLCGGVPRYDLTVLDLVRWGMSGASLRFRDGLVGDRLNLMYRAERYAAPVVGREHHDKWFQGLRHPDAQLIEAAPDLLAMLKAIQFGWNGRCPACAGWGCGPNGETDGAHTKACGVAAAIAKAEGSR